MTEALFQTALQAFQAGDFEHAASVARAELQRQPESVHFNTMLAMAEHGAGRYAEAAEAFRALTVLRPRVPDYWTNLGTMLRLSGRPAEAEEAFKRAMELAPGAYGTLFNYGLLLLDTYRYGAARRCLLDAVDIGPNEVEARIYAALACFECGDSDRAEALLPGASEWEQLDSELRYHLALVLMQLGKVDIAERLLDPAAMEGADTRTLASLAVLLERTNRLTAAQELLERIRRHPSHATRAARVDELQVASLLAMRRRDYSEAQACNAELLELVSSPAAEASACFSMAAIADKQGRPADAMSMLERAHVIHRRFAEEIMPELAIPSREPLQIALDRLHPEQCEFLAEPTPPDVRRPVFIVGFPRSGTTMLEQMLDAHPSYVSMDEQPILSRCVDRMKQFGLGPMELDALTKDQVIALRDGYWADVARTARLAPDQILVDKNPLNLMRLPMIRRLFPEARVILALRHPCDVLLSCYMQDFRSPVFRVLCSSLERLARSYVAAMEFWIYHQALLGVDALVLRYEETVSDFGEQVNRIGAYLGMDSPEYLEQFAEHARRKGFIGTPSYSQVVEPVNNRAVGRWSRYAPWFTSVLPVIQPIADHWGYRLDKA